MEWYDVVVVGGGPAGLSAALFLARACRNVVVIDSGHPRNEVAPALHGFLGRDGIAPQLLLAQGRADLNRYPIVFHHDEVVKIDRIVDTAPRHGLTSFAVHTRQEKGFKARKVLFCTGVRDLLPQLEGIQECYGHSVHHCPYCDGWEHRGRSLIAYAESPHAATGLGLSLRTWSDKVTVVTDGRLTDPTDKRRLHRNDITLIEHEVRRLVHEGPELQGIECDKIGIVPADAFFFNCSHVATCHLPKLLGCDSDPDDIARSSDRQQTNVTGIFVAGDADGDVQFAIVAAAEGATAAVAINRELQEEDRI